MTATAVETQTQNPGKTLGIVGLVLAFVANIVGLIVSIVALRKSKKAGFKNGFAVAGIIISLISIIGVGIAVGATVAGVAAVASACADLGPGEHVLDNGLTITCG
jgi:hypothetical protein